MMIRNQIYIRKDQEISIKEIIKEMNIGTKAAIVRVAIDDYINKWKELKNKNMTGN